MSRTPPFLTAHSIELPGSPTLTFNRPDLPSQTPSNPCNVTPLRRQRVSLNRRYATPELNILSVHGAPYS